MSSVIIDLCYQLCLAVQLTNCILSVHPSCMSETSTLDSMHNLLEPNSFVLAMLVSIMDLNHFIPLSVALTWAESCKVNVKLNMFASFSCTLLH